MVGPEGELFSQLQGNPNEFGKCSNCGKFLKNKKEAKMKMCTDCQKRDNKEEIDVRTGE